MLGAFTVYCTHASSRIVNMRWNWLEQIVHESREAFTFVDIFLLDGVRGYVPQAVYP